jgi:nucleoside-diphosphate-sugar epimerase
VTALGEPRGGSWGRHVVLGKGPVGSTLTDRLAEQGHEVRVLSRSGGASSDGIEHVALDAADGAAVRAAARGADVLYNCANPAYHRWAGDWPPIATALLDAAQAGGAVLVTMSNLYGYGPVDGPMTEDLPLAARGTKGQVRARMWAQALARHEAGEVRVTEARASDFVGPGVVDGGYLGARAVPALLRGKAVQSIGDPDVPHSWTAVGDVADALVVLGADPRAWGRAWHVPTAPPVTFREAVHGLCAAPGSTRSRCGGCRTSRCGRGAGQPAGARARGDAAPVRPAVRAGQQRVHGDLRLRPTRSSRRGRETVAWWRRARDRAALAPLRA